MPKTIVDPLIRFNESHTIAPNGCWIWHGRLWNNDTPCIRSGKKSINVSRWVYENFIGPLPVLNIPATYTCDNKLCVNPKHIFYKTLDQRFWEKVKRGLPDQCWEWQAFKDKDGYGMFQTTGKKANRASRVSWELSFGKIDGDLVVMHTCDNPPCVNPAHLKLGTITDNNRDRAFKKRSRNQNGINNNRAKLDDAAVTVIKYLYSHTRLSHSQIAELFEVSRATISLILENKHWKHHEQKSIADPSLL